MNSMTGFGRGEATNGEVTVVVERDGERVSLTAVLGAR